MKGEVTLSVGLDGQQPIDFSRSCSLLSLGRDSLWQGEGEQREYIASDRWTSLPDDSFLAIDSPEGG